MIYKLQKELDKLLTREEVSKITGIPINTLRHWIRMGRLHQYHMPNNAKYGIRLIDVPSYLRLPKKK
jgi:predicted site-specific integrase-resolvase